MRKVRWEAGWLGSCRFLCADGCLRQIVACAALIVWLNGDFSENSGDTVNRSSEKRKECLVLF